MSSYKEFRAETRKRKAKAATKRFFVVMLLMLMFAAMVFLVMKIMQIVNSRTHDLPQSIADTSTLLAQQPETKTETQQYPLAANGLVIDYPKLPSEQAILAPDARMLSLPAGGQKVDLSYFSDAVFVGDSLADGFRVYLRNQLPETARYFTAKGMSPMSFLTNTWDIDGDGVQTIPLDDITAANPGKIYVEMGINGMSNNQSDEVILKYYTQFVEELQARCPNATIYVQSITPVTQAKAAELPEKFAIERIQGLNNLLAQMCTEHDVVYLNLHEILCNPEGYLNTDLCWPKPDGFHMAPAGYDAWLNYLTLHTVHTAANPYIA